MFFLVYVGAKLTTMRMVEVDQQAHTVKVARSDDTARRGAAGGTPRFEKKNVEIVVHDDRSAPRRCGGGENDIFPRYMLLL